MAAFKRGKTYYIEPTVPGVGRLPRMSTGQSDAITARDMEAALRELANSGLADLVEQLRDSKVKLVEVWQAKMQGRQALERLRDRHLDPLLETVATERKEAITDERTRDGYRMLIELAPKAEKDVAREFDRPVMAELRLSWLLEPRNVTSLYACARDRGLKPNSIRRTLHRAVSDLLARRYSRGRMLSVIADVVTPGENDERKVAMTTEEMQRALEIADVTFRPVIGVALTTGIDRGPMLNDFVRDYDETVGTLVVRDTKTEARPRTLLLRGAPVLENAEYWLRQLIAGRAPNDALVPLTENQLRDRWEAVREKIGRKDLRWKDLRGIFATNYLLAGGQPRDLQMILGHSTMAMTTRYLRATPAGNIDLLKDAARKTGLPAGGHLKIHREA